MQIKRKEFLQEIQEERMLRKLIRKGITIIESRNKNEEFELRSIIRNLILEAKPTDLKQHDETGMNYLENLFSNTSFLTDFKGAYIALATSPRQRESFRAHILNALEGLLSRDRLNRGEDEEGSELGTALKATPDEVGGTNIDIHITDKDNKKKTKVAKQKEDKFKMLPGMDESGATAAELIWPALESNIKNELIKMRDPRDSSVFEKYLYQNIIEYFKEWEEVMVSKKGARSGL